VIPCNDFKLFPVRKRSTTEGCSGAGLEAGAGADFKFVFFLFVLSLDLAELIAGPIDLADGMALPVGDDSNSCVTELLLLLVLSFDISAIGMWSNNCRMLLCSRTTQ